MVSEKSELNLSLILGRPIQIKMKHA